MNRSTFVTAAVVVAGSLLIAEHTQAGELRVGAMLGRPQVREVPAQGRCAAKAGLCCIRGSTSRVKFSQQYAQPEWVRELARSGAREQSDAIRRLVGDRGSVRVGKVATWLIRRPNGQFVEAAAPVTIWFKPDDKVSIDKVVSSAMRKGWSLRDVTYFRPGR